MILKHQCLKCETVFEVDPAHMESGSVIQIGYQADDTVGPLCPSCGFRARGTINHGKIQFADRLYAAAPDPTKG